MTKLSRNTYETSLENSEKQQKIIEKIDKSSKY